MQKLISMADFVLEQSKIEKSEASEMSWLWEHVYEVERIEKYANFLKHPLNLSMFIRCKLVNGVWFVLEKPKNYSAFEVGMSSQDFRYNVFECVEYKESKDRVLFNEVPFHFPSKNTVLLSFKETIVPYNLQEQSFYCDKLNIIEDLIKYNLELTETAKKQIYGIQ